jgi:hypothetical protein
LFSTMSQCQSKTLSISLRLCLRVLALRTVAVLMNSNGDTFLNQNL